MITSNSIQLLVSTILFPLFLVFHSVSRIGDSFSSMLGAKVPKDIRLEFKEEAYGY